MEVLLEFPGQAAPRRVKEIYDPYSRSFPMADARHHALKLKCEKAACQKEGIYDIDEQKALETIATAHVETKEIAVQCCPQHFDEVAEDKGGAQTAPLAAETVPGTVPEAPTTITKGYVMQNGRLTRVQKTARPPNIWPEL